MTNDARGLLREAVDALTAAGVPDPRVDAELLLASVLGASRGRVQSLEITGCSAPFITESRLYAL